MGTSKNRGFFWSKFLLKQKANGKFSDHFFVEQAGKIHLLDPQQVLMNLLCWAQCLFMIGFKIEFLTLNVTLFAGSTAVV